MEKSNRFKARSAVKIALLVLLCVIGVCGIVFSPRNFSGTIGTIDDSFSWKAYSYTPVTGKVLYNYAFPSEEVALTSENQQNIAAMLSNSKIKRRFPGSWNPYGINTRIPCAIALEIENVGIRYNIFLCKDSSEEFLLLQSSVRDTKWYDLKNSELLQYLNTLFPYDTIGTTVTHIVGTNH